MRAWNQGSEQELRPLMKEVVEILEVALREDREAGKR